MSASVLDTARALGFPWDRLADAVDARLGAQRVAESVVDSDSEPERAAAAFELETALLAERNRRGDVADALLVMIQAAIDERFDSLWAKVMGFATRAEWHKAVERFYSTQPGGTAWCAAIQERLEEQAKEITRLKAENWELACEFAQLERDVIELKGGGNGPHGQRTEGHGERDGEQRAPDEPHHRQAG